MLRALTLAALCTTAAGVMAAPAVLDTRAAPALIVVLDPPELLPCGARGWSLLLPSGAVLSVVRMGYLPASLGLVAVPQAPGRVFCDGFEVRA
jgi:hypothetical protein